MTLSSTPWPITGGPSPHSTQKWVWDSWLKSFKCNKPTSREKRIAGIFLSWKFPRWSINSSYHHRCVLLIVGPPKVESKLLRETEGERFVSATKSHDSAKEFASREKYFSRSMRVCALKNRGPAIIYLHARELFAFSNCTYFFAHDDAKFFLTHCVFSIAKSSCKKNFDDYNATPSL